MLPLVSISLALSALTEARVTFPHSEVLQRFDVYREDHAYFNCEEGCKIYVDYGYEWMKIAQNDEIIANFSEIRGQDKFVPDGYELPAGVNYTIPDVHDSDDFVFYVVSTNAPNFGAPVYIVQEGSGFGAQGKSRFQTFITDANALIFYGFSDTAAPGYPKIYATGYDAVSDDMGCTPVYQARSQQNAHDSTITVLSYIVTIDFGAEADHSLSVTATNEPIWLSTAVSSTVYMSQGFVGCPSVDGIYMSRITKFHDEFMRPASSLDISAVFNEIKESNAVQLRVNDDTFKFFNAPFSNSFTKHYNEGDFDVDIAWSSGSITASWAVQLDFGTPTTPAAPETTTSDVSTTTKQAANQPTTKSTPQPTTSSAHSLTVFASMIVAIVSLL